MQRKFLMPLTLVLGLLIPLLAGLLIALVNTSPARAQETTETPPECPPEDQALVGVWGQGRLGMTNACQKVSGTVLQAEHELDGDLDLYLDLDPDYDQLAGSSVDLNNLHQWGPGDVIVELMPRDGGHLPAPSEGDRIDLTGALVADSNHGYNEIHPVWSETIKGGDANTSGPENGGSLPQSTAQTAAADCKDGNGAPCTGYSE
jgi:hypothetical protein